MSRVALPVIAIEPAHLVSGSGRTGQLAGLYQIGAHLSANRRGRRQLLVITANVHRRDDAKEGFVNVDGRLGLSSCNDTE